MSNRKRKKFVRQLKCASQKHSGLFKWAAESPGRAQKTGAAPKSGTAPEAKGGVCYLKSRVFSLLKSLRSLYAWSEHTRFAPIFAA